MSCRHVRDWLHRDAGSLDEAQRLQLDDHLASCEACRGDRARMQMLHRAGTSLDSPPSESRMYDRAIARALLEGPRIAEPVRARWMWPVALGALLATAFAAVVAMRSASEPSKAPDVVAPSTDVTAGSGEPHVQSVEREDVVVEDPAPKQPEALESIAAILARARKQLAAKQYTLAERTASSVLSRASGADEAEARTILADVAQASGQLDLASTRYREVAKKFASLSAGEAALYAAARVEARRGGDSRALLETYLARYPRGRFVEDVRRLLQPEEKR